MSIVLSSLAVGVAIAALWMTHWYRVRDDLIVLMRQYESRSYAIRMWRLEQLTRLDHERWDIAPIARQDLEPRLDPTKLRLLQSALASNWADERADMQAFYFFVLQVAAWLTPAMGGRTARARVKHLNEVFGYSLFSTILDHQLTALRLLPNPGSGVPQAAWPAYYATHYGLFDPGYRRVADLVARDLLTKRDLPPRIEEVLSKKAEAIAVRLANLAPQAASSTVPPGETGRS